MSMSARSAPGPFAARATTSAARHGTAAFPCTYLPTRAMMLSMSTPQQGSTLIPSLRYRDAHAAIDWLVRVFGFKKQAVYDGPDGKVMHAQLTHGLGMLMLGSVSDDGEFHKIM